MSMREQHDVKVLVYFGTLQTFCLFFESVCGCFCLFVLCCLMNSTEYLWLKDVFLQPLYCVLCV